MTNEQLALIATEALGMGDVRPVVVESISLAGWELTDIVADGLWPATRITIAHRDERALVISNSFSAASEFLQEIRPDLVDVAGFCAFFSRYFERFPRFGRLINSDGKSLDYAPSFSNGVLTFYWEVSLHGVQRVTIDQNYKITAKYIEVYSYRITAIVVGAMKDCLVLDVYGEEILLPFSEVFAPALEEQIVCSEVTQVLLIDIDAASNRLVGSRRVLFERWLAEDAAEQKLSGETT